MALRATHSSSLQVGISPGKAVASELAGFNFYCSDPQDPPLLKREKWMELLTVAMMAKHSISLTDLTRLEGTARIPARMRGPAEDAAKKSL